ncbi:MAG: DUF115 domain-containing protein [Magnetococcales bacterium]|nr:DUF115 domain-containing protein [Magnetococcales bacterium]
MDTQIGTFRTNRFGEPYLPLVNKESFSANGSAALYQQHFGEAFKDKDYLYIITGTDSGLLPAYIRRKGLPDGSRFLFVELPEIIAALAAAGIGQDLPANMALCTPLDWEAKAAEFSIRDYFYLGNVAMLRSLAALDANLVEYAGLHANIANSLHQHRMNNLVETGTQIFMLRGLENLAENRLPATLLEEAFPGKTAVLLAAGPSLSEILPWVKAHRQEIVLLAVSRLAAKLQAEGLTPDIFFSIDPHDVAFFASREMLRFGERSLLVSLYHCTPRLVGQWRGRHLYMGPRFLWATPLNVKNHQFPGITVSHQALGLALFMGFSQVILGGFDLCFTKEGFTHAKGSVESDMGPFMDQTEYKVETNGGWLAETRSDFFSAIPSLAELARMGQERGVAVINPAEGAARISGVEHRPLGEIRLDPLDSPAWERLQTLLPPDSAESRQAHAKAMIEELARVREEVSAIRKLAVEGLECNARFFGRKGRAKGQIDYRYKLRMDEVEKEIDTRFHGSAVLVKRWGIREFLKLVRPDKNREWSDADIEEMGARYYRTYQESATAMLKLLDTTRQRLQMRLEEESPNPNLKMLLQQWQNDNQPGRARLFLQNHPAAAQLPQNAKLLPRFEEAGQRFEEQITQQEHLFKQLIRNKVHPYLVRLKGAELFRQKDADRLRHILAGLENSQLAEKEELLALFRGFVAELSEDFDAALDEYDRVKRPYLREESLGRSSAIHLKRQRLDLALPVLAELAQLSPINRPHYASLLRLTGRLQESIAQYREYLSINPADPVARLRLGQALLDAGVPQEAASVVRPILDEDPGHVAALRFLESLPLSPTS